MRGLHWSLSKKIIVGFALIMAALMVFIFYANSNFNDLLRQYDLALESHQKLNEVFDCLASAREYLRHHCITGVQTSVNGFLRQYNRCYRLVRAMKAQMDDAYGYGKLIDFERMLRSYGEKANEALHFYGGKDTYAAYESLVDSERILTLIQGRYAFYAKLLMQSAEASRLALLQARDGQNIANLTIIVGLTLLCAAFAGIFIRAIQKPIKKLVENAEQISRGNFFNLPQITMRSRDELALLANAFNEMVKSIKYYIREKDLKAELQERLMEEENKNLKTEALLKQTQLNALQAQINPHFLFNTLNMIQQSAYLENATETRTMIETTAQLLRFYLDKADMNVFLLEEMEHVADYIYIQNKRIGGRIRFDMRIDPDITNLVIPGLIIQPVLENAIIHGLDNCMSDGRVDIHVAERPECVQIAVSDNGKGMDGETVERILGGQQAKDAGSIGLQNVIKRLEFFFGRKGLVAIFSEPGAGVRIEITLPKGRVQEGHPHV